jgi:hypothetical protein
MTSTVIPPEILKKVFERVLQAFFEAAVWWEGLFIALD